jgi:hypothetical protein
MNQKQLNECIVDLAKRADELQESGIAAVLFTLIGAINMPGNSVDRLAEVCIEFAKGEIAIIEELK